MSRRAETQAATSMPRVRTRAGVIALLTLAFAAWARPARADSAECRVRSIEPSPQAAPADLRLDDIKGILSSLPWKSYRLIGDQALSLQLGRASSSLPLPDGKLLTLTYLEHLAAVPRHRVRIHLVVRTPQPASPPVVDTTFTIDEGGTVFQMLDDGATKLLVAETCKTTT